jgi:hypothetical protein
MRQAIVTKYLGPTNHRGGRVKATADYGSAIVEWNHELNSFENHQAAVEAFCNKFGFPTYGYVAGSFDKGYAWVRV